MLRFICRCKDKVFYAASPTNVWRLMFVSVDKQIKQLIDKNDFELALKLAVSRLLM